MSEDLWTGLSRIDEALALVQGQPERGTSDWLFRNSLVHQRNEIKQQIVSELAGQQRPVLQYVLEGPAVAAERLDARFLGLSLVKLQETLTAVGQAVEGKVRATGRIPSDIQARTRLQFAGTVYGSFGVLLEGDEEPIQTELLPDGRPPRLGLLEESIVRVFDVLESTARADADEDTLLDTYADLGERAVGRLKELSDELANQPARLRMAWSGPLVPERSITLDRVQILSVNRFLAGVDTRAETIELDGRLAGARFDTDVFFFREADSERLVQGAMAEEVIDKARDLVARACRATVQETLFRTRAGGHEARKYVLLDLAPLTSITHGEGRASPGRP